MNKHQTKSVIGLLVCIRDKGGKGSANFTEKTYKLAIEGGYLVYMPRLIFGGDYNVTVKGNGLIAGEAQ